MTMMMKTTGQEAMARRADGATQTQPKGGVAAVGSVKSAACSGEAVSRGKRGRGLSKGPGYGRYTDREWALMDFGRHVTMARDWLREAAKDRTKIGKESCVRYARYAGRKARAAYAEAFPKGKSDPALRDKRVPTKKHGKEVAA